MKIAENLAAGNGYSSAPKAPYQPEVFRAPFYPVFLSFFLALKLPLSFAIPVQLLLYFGAIICVSRLARDLTDDPMAERFTALILAGYAPMVRWAVAICTESVCYLLLAVVGWIFVRHIRQPRLSIGLTMAVCCSLLMLTRSEYLGLGGLLVLGFLGTLRKRTLQIATVLPIVLMTVVGTSWVLRNLRVIPEFRPAGIGLGMTLLVRSVELQEPSLDRRAEIIQHNPNVALWDCPEKVDGVLVMPR